MSEMNRLIAEFPDQLLESYPLHYAESLPRHSTDLTNVLIMGMGGSGIAGQYLQRMSWDCASVPIQCLQDYRLPHWVNEHSFVLLSSYSGNTEETLHVAEAAAANSPNLAMVSSGGQLLEMAKNAAYPHIALPQGKAAPRACLGYSLVAQLQILQDIGVINGDLLSAIRTYAPVLKMEREGIQDKARQLAYALRHRLVAIYSGPELKPVAVRFRQQLAENAKMLAWHHYLPEMSHNEIVGWQYPYPSVAVLYLRNSYTHVRNQYRLDFMTDITRRQADATISLPARGDTLCAQVLYLTHLLDWTSFYLAEIQERDPMDITHIYRLKEWISEK